jgi:leader peptidase (prepilin peptidase)/N-methyltransferase
MSAHLAVFGGALIGMVAGALLVPLTQRELVGAMARAAEVTPVATPSVRAWHRSAVVIVSGAIPALVLLHVGWSIVALPPLLLFLGLVQLGYCDLSRHLLPKPMVHVTTATVAMSEIVVAGLAHEWHRMVIATVCGVSFAALLYAMNLMNPNWIAFGDVRLAPAVGLGLAWVSPSALLEGFFVANLLAAVVGLALIAGHKANRKTALPFGLYLAVASGIIIVAWS